MIVYLVHANANLSSEQDGYVMGMRESDYPNILYSFAYARNFCLPIKPIEESAADDHLPCEC